MPTAVQLFTSPGGIRLVQNGCGNESSLLCAPAATVPCGQGRSNCRDLPITTSSLSRFINGTRRVNESQFNHSRLLRNNNNMEKVTLFATLLVVVMTSEVLLVQARSFGDHRNSKYPWSVESYTPEVGFTFVLR